MMKNLRVIHLSYIVFSFLFCGGTWRQLDARKIEILIAIPLMGSHLDVVRNTIAEIQENVEKAAMQNGYELNTSLSSPDKMHITLEQIVDVDEENLEAYKKCVAQLAQKAQAFDITDQFKKARFDIIGWAKNWGVLRFPTPKKNPLDTLAFQLKNCLKKNSLKTGMFPWFKAHVSLGKFLKNDNGKLPKSTELSWLPEIKIELPESSFMINDIVLMTREKLLDQETGKAEYIEGKTYHFPLGVQKTQKNKVIQKRDDKLMNEKKEASEAVESSNICLNTPPTKPSKPPLIRRGAASLLYYQGTSATK